MNSNVIFVFAKWQVAENQLPNVLNLLNDVAEKSRAESGNLFYKIHQSQTDENTLILSEAYQDENALNKHRNSEHFQGIVVNQIVPLLANREVYLTNQILN
ncbi:antibiotic biosynthesis monooxygenase [Emticicia aquatilis]|uniref:Antibiotic biosynthesis monooxygenase n=1 Tax=Emticicia aquatilis TaxID=1537369 RepID=A0A917DP09_9BACT|nr:putative quinol monooxygenase [Emticicia aquatilis]GGD52847.1 antibiotic biosynthesis monooxygenase [Emticicia aquatilis]